MTIGPEILDEAGAGRDILGEDLAGRVDVLHVAAREATGKAAEIIEQIAAAVADPSAGMGAYYAGQFLMLNYSREDETQADLSGLDYMVEAGSI